MSFTEAFNCLLINCIVCSLNLLVNDDFHLSPSVIRIGINVNLAFRFVSFAAVTRASSWVLLKSFYLNE